MSAPPASNSSRPLPERPTPPRSYRLFIAAYWIALGGFVLFVVWKLIVRQLEIIWSNPWLGSLAFLALAFLLAYRFGRRQVMRNFLAPHGGFVCPRCHYGLRTLPDEGVCPECGTEYTRASVVSLWEHAYGLPARFPRISARSAHAPVPQRARQLDSTSPWSRWNLPDAVALVEAGARARGFASARFPTYAKELRAADRSSLPSDLQAFFAWIDPALWNRFIHPGRPPASAAAGPAVPLNEWLAQPELPAEHIRLRPPSQCVRRTIAGCPSAVAFLERMESSDHHAPWRDTPVVEFADADSGAAILYCVLPPGLPSGTVIALHPAGAHPIWLADSLAQWLIRMAICNGVDAILDPTLQDGLLPNIQHALERDAAAHDLAKRTTRSAGTEPSSADKR